MRPEEGLWKLLEAKSTQLVEAVSGGRTPFLLAMAWAFVWSVALYVNFGGYTTQLVDRYHQLANDAIQLRKAFTLANGGSAATAAIPSISVLVAPSTTASATAPASATAQALVTAPAPTSIAMSASTPVSSPILAIDWKCPARIATYGSILAKCAEYIAPDAFSAEDFPRSKDPEHCNGTAIAACLARLDVTTSRYEVAQHESKFVQFAGIPVRVHYSDLGTIGQGGMLLLMAWTYYAFRRENHAIRQFVEFQARSKFVPSWHLVRALYLFGLRKYTLEPQGFFRARHLSFAYGSVAQRFLLFLTREGRPLRFATILLFVFPIAVQTFNLGTDLHDDFGKLWSRFPDEHSQILFNDIVESLIFLTLISIEIRALSEMVESSVLLHGWFLACREHWDKSWEDATDPVARPLAIDVERQVAEPA